MKPVSLFQPPRTRLLVLMACLAATLSAHAQIVTNWSAYNDHRPSTTPVAGGWPITAPRVTGFDMGAPNDSSGTLINFQSGDPLPVTVTFTRTGAPQDFGSRTRPLPTNTPAAALFYGICDLANDGLIGLDTTAAATNSVLITISGLNTAKHYVFRGTGARNGGYAPRWSLATINADGWVDAHLNGSGPGVITSNNFPNLGAGQAAWNSGHNAQGAVVGWDFITPHPDGTFTINMEQYIGPTPGGGTAVIDNYGYSFDAMLLAEVEVTPPNISVQPQAQVSVVQNRPFSLSVTASGTPLFYQWYKVGSGAIGGQHFATYSVAQAAVADSGDYFVVVSNPLGNRTSTVSHVTISLDTAAPVVAAVVPFPTVAPGGASAALDQIVVEFDEPVQAGSVATPANYTLNPGGSHPVSIVVTNDRSVVLQLSAAMTEDTDYTLTTTGARDVVGNTAGNASTPFHTWVAGIGNGLLFEAFHAGSGVEVDTILASPDYPNNPYLRATLPIFDSRAVFPDNTQEQYGGRIRGVFIPPVSGNYTFFMRTFDRGVVYLNPNGLDPAGKQEILRESTGNNPRNWDKFASSLFSLRAGQGYYIEALYKADAGTDVMKVAARLQGTGVPTPVDAPDTDVDPNSISGGAIAFPLAPRNLGGTLTITQDLADQTADELNPTTFTVQVSNPSLLPLQYQWYRNGAAIAGANGPSYTLQPTVADDNGAKLKVQVAKVGNVVTSREATLTVVPDVHPPHLTGVTSSTNDLSSIEVHFNEHVNTGEANDLFNYGLTGPGGDVNFNSVALQPDSQTVILTFTDPLLLGASYTLSVGNVTDLAGLTINPNPNLLTFTAGGVSGLPRLSIRLDGNTAVISWPDPSTGFILEQTSQLGSTPASTVWTAVPDPVTVANGQKTVTVTLGTGTRLYRLHQ